MDYLDFINSHLYLYLAIIIALLILDIILTIVCINQRKRRKIKNEYREIEKIEEENEKLEDDIKPEVAFELEEILAKMQQDIDAKPEDVVRQFEEEQEQQAIISYQELVDSVNNNKLDVIDDGEEGDIDFVAALENGNKPILKEVIDKNEKGPIISTLDITEDKGVVLTNDSIQNKSHLDVIDELNLDNSSKKFRNSEILSPVFGRMQPEYEYKKIPSFINSNNKIEIEQVAGDSIENDIKNNEDFLKALIEFRNNL